MRMQQASGVTAIVLSMLVAACGGGGGGNDQKPATPSAQGFYNGTAIVTDHNGVSVSLPHKILVLDNDQFYDFWGVSSPEDTFEVISFQHGNGKSHDNGSYVATDTRDYDRGGAVPGSLYAIYTPKVSLDGLLTVADGSSPDVAFSSTFISRDLYNYDSSADLANISGNWNARIFSIDQSDAENPTISSAVNLTISPSGEINGSTVGCVFTGSAQPRISGKNVFDIALTFGAVPCAAPGQTLNGIIVEYALAGGKQQMLLAGANATRNYGISFSAIR